MKDPFDRPARPWDLFNKNLGRVIDDIAANRMDECLGCDRLIQATKTCKECGCYMPSKTTLPNASCPIGKWDVVVNQPSYKEEE